MTPDHVAGLASVIIPTYNREALVLDALASVEAQTYRPIEVLVMDDGSTDDTADVVRQWAETHATDGFSVEVHHQDNAGAPAARNAGLAASRGEYIQFLDSDDLITTSKLADQVEALQAAPHADVAWSDYASVADTSAVDLAARAFPGATIHARGRDVGLVGIPIKIAVGLVRRRACVAAGPWDRIRRHQDWVWTLRLIVQGAQSVYLPGVRYVEYDHQADRISSLNHNPQGAMAADNVALDLAMAMDLTSPLAVERVANRAWALVRAASAARDRVHFDYALGLLGRLAESPPGLSKSYRQRYRLARVLGCSAMRLYVRVKA